MKKCFVVNEWLQCYTLTTWFSNNPGLHDLLLNLKAEMKYKTATTRITHKTGHRNGWPPSTTEILLYDHLSLFAGPVVGAISRQLPKVSRLLRAARGLPAGPVPKPCCCQRCERVAGLDFPPAISCAAAGASHHTALRPRSFASSLVAYPWASKLNQCILRKSLELSLPGSAINSLQEFASHCVKRC